MPTVKPRIQVTETDELAAALEVARELWPNESKSAQVALLAQRGAESAIEDRLAKALELHKVFADFYELIKDSYKGVDKDSLRAAWERP